MSDERTVDDIVTEFLLNTCLLRPQSRSEHTVTAGLYCCAAAAATQPDDVDITAIPLPTGSAAEFYIEPILPHIGDIDMMFYHNTELAIPRGHPPPTQLPAQFHNFVKVFEIIDSHLPGYVNLELRYLLTEFSDNDNYNTVEYDRGQYLAHQSYIAVGEIGPPVHRHGPAIVYHFPDTTILSTMDYVSSIRCLLWPLQAADWPTRHRNYG